MNLNELESFIRVVDLGSLAAAARDLEVPKSTISRRISRLEDELHVELLRRDGRRVAVTEDGRLLHARCAAALRQIDDAARAVGDSREEPQGRLVLSAPPDLGLNPRGMDLFVQYRRRYPGVQLDLRFEGRMVDLVAEGYDLAIRAHGGPIPAADGLMSRAMGQARGHLYASTEYVRERGAPRDLEELLEHDFVLHVEAADRANDFVHVSGEVVRDFRFPPPAVHTNNFTAVRDLLVSGLGIGILPRLPNVDAPEDPTLVRILPEWSIGCGNLTLLWPATQHLSPRVRAFIELVTELLESGACSGAD